MNKQRVFILVLIILAFFLISLIFFKRTAFAPYTNNSVAYLKNPAITLDVARTEAARTKGLGGRVQMADNRGMLFIFDTEDTQCFWMKDMHFPLDIIWLDKNKKIQYIQEAAMPNSYPRQFCPSVPAMYVIEVNAGTVKENGLKVGKDLEF